MSIVTKALFHCLVGILAGMMLAACATHPSVNSADLALPVPPVPEEGESFLPPGSGWDLVWSDEFSEDALDRSRWEVEVSCWGGGNNERQCYTDRVENVDLVNGVLRLKALPERISGPEYPQGWETGRGDRVTRDYSSGKIRTRNLASWTYGRFSARIRLPKGQGTWPAFWMLPAENVYGRWAASGEIDIMEAVNLGEVCAECSGSAGENRTSGALHFGQEWPDNTFLVRHHTLPGGEPAPDEFHVYSVEWGQGQINWFVDDELFFTLHAKDWSRAEEDVSGPVSAAPFDQDFYLLLNLAVGGGLSETNNRKGFDPKSFPAQMLVDWVRVYTCAEDPETGLACMQGR